MEKWKKIMIIVAAILLVVIILVLVNSAKNKSKINTEPTEEASTEQSPSPLSKIFTDSNHFSIHLSQDENYDIDITLNAIFNAGVNGPPIEDQEKAYKEEIKKYKQDALDWIKSNGINPNTLKINWIPEEAKSY